MMTKRPGGYFGTMSGPRLTPEQEAQILATIPKISRSETEAQARPRAQRVYANGHVLTDIIDRHELRIQKRWSNMSKLKRREILLSAWPGMPVDHRPDHVAVQKYLQGIGTAKMAVTSMVKVTYPMEKRQTRETVEACLKAEMALDELWKMVFIDDARRLDALSPCCQQILEREPYRTPQWTEPIPKPKAASQDSAGLDSSFQAFGLDAKAPAFVSARPQEPKSKTRGQPLVDAGEETAEPAVTQPATDSSDSSSKAPPVQVAAKSLKVFKTIFFVPSTASQPGEVAWDNFLHAMRHVGFDLEKLGGSAWHFMPAEPPSTDFERRSICFHEPHPQAKLSFWMARRVGRRLQRTYGWNFETFSSA